MNIFYINIPRFNYVDSMLIEGLTEIGHTVRTTSDSNRGNPLPVHEQREFAENSDLVCFASDPYGWPKTGVLVEDIVNPHKICIDGDDFGEFVVPASVQWKAVFKRELCSRYTAPRVFPLPMAVEKRYFVEPAEKDIKVSFLCNTRTNFMRNSIKVRLDNLRDPQIVTGMTGERAYSESAPQKQAIATPLFSRLMARTLIGVSAPGWGNESARYWETPAAQAMLFTYAVDHWIPEPFKDGRDCVTFASLAEFDEKLDYYLAHLPTVREIAATGYAHLRAHHTAAKRAEYFVREALGAVRQPGFYGE